MTTTTQNEAASEVTSPDTAVEPQKQPIDWTSWLIWLSLAVIIGVSAYAISRRQPATTTVWVPIRDLPTYHLIMAADVTTKTTKTSEEPKDVVSTSASLALRYTLQPLLAGRTIQESQLVPVTDTALISDTMPVSIPATAAMAFNGQLAPGAIVTVWTVTDTGKAEPLLAEALVLDVQKVEGQSETEDNTLPYVIVLAVPSPKQAELITAVASDSLILTLTP